MGNKSSSCKPATTHLLPKNKGWFWLSLLVSCTASGNLKALAQTVPPLPPAADPSRIQKQLQPPLTLPQKQEITVPDREEFTSQPKIKQQKFYLNSLQVEGATVYSSYRLQKLNAEFLGRDISLGDLYQIANRITQLYRKDGYVLSQAVVPAQTISHGTARLQVIEGFVERVDFTGAPQAQLNRLKRFGDKIVEARPLNMRSLERYLLLTNDLAGIQTRGVLSPGSRVGAAILTVSVKYNPTNKLEVNSRSSNSVGPLQSQTAQLLNSLTGSGEQITVSQATTPIDPSELTATGIGVSVPIGYEGLRFAFNGDYTSVRPGKDLSQYDIDGNTYSASLGVGYPLIRSRAGNLLISGAFDWSNRAVTTRFTGTEETLSQDRLRVLRAGVNFNRTDVRGAWLGNIQVSQGIGGLGATTEGTAAKPLSRSSGSAAFTKVNLHLIRQQSLPGGLSLQLAGVAQITGNSLLVSEQFGLGGDEFGRAFDPSQVLGDSGYALRAELGRQFTYKVGRGQRFAVTQPYIFYDYGQVFRKHTSAAEHGQDMLSSVGLGVRQSLNDSFSLQAELGFPLMRTDSSFNRDPRIFVTLKGSF
jgi:hemolysin activation/secretion protein